MTPYLMIRRYLCVLLCAFLLLGTQARAQESALKIGVLSFRPKPVALEQWQPLTRYLGSVMPDVSFSLQVYNFDEMQEAIRQQAVDIVLTQPAEYVRMVHQNGLSSPLATIINLELGKPVRVFGGVVLARSDQRDISDLHDLMGKRIVTPSMQSFGAYQMQAYEMVRQRITPASIVETGLPQDLAVYALLNDHADAAYVRTGVLEAMMREGRLDASLVKVVGLQTMPGYPFALSTRLYPEWPVVAMSHVAESTAVRVAGALLSLPQGGPIARSMGIHGFTIPSDYEPVRALMRELRVPPFDTTVTVTFQDVWQQYQPVILAMLATLLTVLALVGREIYLRKRIDSFGNAMGEGMFVLDRRGRVSYVNRMACKLLGYPKEALLGEKLLDLVLSPVGNPLNVAHAQTLSGSECPNLPAHGERVFVNARGESFPVEISSRPVLRRGKLRHSVTVFSDITERKAQNERLYELAYYTPLTHLPNRRLLLDKLQQALDANTPTRQPGALLFSDLDRFKQLNDTLGHAFGDALLQAVAKRFRHTVGEAGTVAHTGGDEFAVLLNRLDHTVELATEQTRALAEKIRVAMQEPFEITGQQHKLSVSVGIAMFLGDEANAEELLKRADIAMYQAKASGRNAIRFFDQVIEAQLTRQVSLEADLHRALKEDQFELFYQPQVNANGQVVGVEALVRWRHPQRGLVMPGEFIALAEENGLILPLGEWVLAEACRQLVAWRDKPATAGLVVAVNLCALQIFQNDFVASVVQILRQTGANPALLQLELTESVLAKNIDDVIDKMGQLAALGVTFSLDDFGTGYSSLNYLKRLPLHQLKIDGSFVRDLMLDPNDVAITKTIIALGQSLDLEVIAEGVETEDQRNVLLRQGCTLFQGYLFGRPQPEPVLTGLLDLAHSTPDRDD